MIKEEATESRAEVKSFDHGKLKHVETAEKNPLPTQADIKEELRPETLPDVSAVKDFDQHQLKHVETQEKSVLPTKEGKQSSLTVDTQFQAASKLRFISLMQPYLKLKPSF